ncbi:hypothetical protein, partial [Kitasatospora aureofaciens]|uniref:hypothetical protein n=1 Tax=Kitasatospora aureofaciens TaxID=1894 RepID=UPI00131AC6D8
MAASQRATWAPSAPVRHQGGRPLVRVGRNLDQSAPAVGVLQGDDAPEAPQPRLRRVGLAVGLRCRARGHAPHLRLDARVHDALEQGDGGPEGAVETEEGDDPGRRAVVLGEERGDDGPVSVGHGDRDDGAPRSPGFERPDDRPHDGVVLEAGRNQGEPGAGEAVRAGRFGEGLPGDLVAPGVHGGLFAA